MKVQFLKNTSQAIIDYIPKNTILVYRDGYNLPEIKGVEYIDFNEYKIKYNNIECEKMILVGINRLITPSNRCDMVNDYMQTMTDNIDKISIDTEPWIGEPWRLWYHYSIASCGSFGINYSYALETEWKKWFYREVSDCRLSGDNVRMFISDTYSDLEQLKTKFTFSDITPLDQEYYDQVKNHVFEKYNTPKSLINFMMRDLNNYFDIKVSLDSYRENRTIDLPNLQIYKFIAEENLRRMHTYNEVIK